jgi:hypothetical protein
MLNPRLTTVLLQDISSAVGIIDTSFKLAPASSTSTQSDSATLLGAFGVLFGSFESMEWTNDSIESAHESPRGTIRSTDAQLDKVLTQNINCQPLTHD